MGRTSFWTIEKIKIGFERFKNRHARLPSASEVDQVPYLPSSRWIQLNYGGLERLRKQLGYRDSHFGKGMFRSRISSRVGQRGRDAEIRLEIWLRNKFGEVFVHTERIFDNSKRRVDFFVYSPEENFGIDVFCSDTLRSMQSSLNIKQKKYQNFSKTLYLTVAQSPFTQDELDKCVRSKINKLPENTELLTLENLVLKLKKRKSYPNPLTRHKQAIARYS